MTTLKQWLQNEYPNIELYNDECTMVETIVDILIINYVDCGECTESTHDDLFQSLINGFMYDGGVLCGQWKNGDKTLSESIIK